MKQIKVWQDNDFNFIILAVNKWLADEEYKYILDIKIFATGASMCILVIYIPEEKL